MTLSDGEVLAHVMAGDRDAYASLFAKYGRLVHALALARTTRSTAAVEVTRQAFVKARDELDRIPEGMSFAQFLMLTVREVATEHVREHGRSLQMLRVGSEETGKSSGPVDLKTVLGDMQTRDAALILLEIIGRLPPNYEGPILLRYLEGMSYAEIAGVLDVNTADVRTDLDSAWKLLEREFRLGMERAE
ncbi:MAG: RNA polymerase sigma factor [Planctomycetota bacterium]|jgi:RNA polymerase sigma-70 factor (ECF subfamily)